MVLFSQSAKLVFWTPFTLNLCKNQKLSTSSCLHQILLKHYDHFFVYIKWNLGIDFYTTMGPSFRACSHQGWNGLPSYHTFCPNLWVLQEVTWQTPLGIFFWCCQKESMVVKTDSEQLAYSSFKLFFKYLTVTTFWTYITCTNARNHLIYSVYPEYTQIHVWVLEYYDYWTTLIIIVDW